MSEILDEAKKAAAAQGISVEAYVRALEIGPGVMFDLTRYWVNRNRHKQPDPPTEEEMTARRRFFEEHKDDPISI